VAYNVRYFRDQGAKFAFLTAVMPAVVSLSEEEIDFLFTVPGIITADGTEPQSGVRGEVGPRREQKVAPRAAQGDRHRQAAPDSVTAIIRAGLTATMIRKKYEEYPDHPMAFGGWKDRVDPQWVKADQARHDFFEKLLREWT